MKLLVIEDEANLNQNLCTYLEQAGYVCESASAFWEAHEKIHVYDYDVVVVDLTLPGGNGLELIQELKRIQSRAGIIVISARRSLADKIQGLDLGADDYLAKPFHLSELHARIRALVRRKFQQGATRMAFEEIEIIPAAQEVFVQGQALSLTTREYELLMYFMVNKNRVLSKAAIVEHLWGDHMDMADSYDFLYNHIKNLRKKIQLAGGKDYLKTIYGLGYKYSAH